MKTVRFLKNYLAFKKGKVQSVTSRHGSMLITAGIAEEVVKKENKEASKRETK